VEMQTPRMHGLLPSVRGRSGDDEFPKEAPTRLMQQMLDYAKDVSGLKTPMEVLNSLHAITSRNLTLNVLAAISIPSRSTDWDALAAGETVYLHGSAPKGWWEEWIRQAQHKLPIGYAIALLSMAPYTMTESLQMLQPVGADRRGFELALKYGIRDAFFCPVGGRWILAFWAPKPMTKTITEPVRILLFTAASFAAMRLDQLVKFSPASKQLPLSLTPRELAVLRLLSIGSPFKEIAGQLQLGEETIRTHLRKAQSKLGVRNRTEAVAEALRRRLIP
jgi:DNA-binding CsgD family transcriptional regulator